MPTNGVQKFLFEDDEPESGTHLREEVRQSLSNALDMMTMHGDFLDGWPVIAVRAPQRVGAHRFMSAVGGIAAHIETLSLPRWRATISFERPETEMVAYIVLNPAGLFPPDINQTVDFLGCLGIRPED